MESDATPDFLGLAGELRLEDAEHLRREVDAVDRHAAPGDGQEHPPGAAGYLEDRATAATGELEPEREVVQAPVGGVRRVVVSGGRFVEAPFGVAGCFRGHGFSVQGNTHSGSFVPLVRISHLRFPISNQQIGAQNPWDSYYTTDTAEGAGVEPARLSARPPSKRVPSPLGWPFRCSDSGRCRARTCGLRYVRPALSPLS